MAGNHLGRPLRENLEWDEAESECKCPSCHPERRQSRREGSTWGGRFNAMEKGTSAARAAWALPRAVSALPADRKVLRTASALPRMTRRENSKTKEWL